MADFLLELLTEEIPARMQKGARAELEKLFTRELSAAGVAAGDITVWSTPRRLALIARDLPTETEAVREEAKGPPVGAPDQAVDGFCRKNGVTRDQLEEREVKGRATYFAVIEKPGQKVADLLSSAVPAIIRDFSWPKSMRWGEASISSESTRWVRPLSGIIALLGGEVVSCEAAGLSSGRTTMGHRFHSNGLIGIDDADDYAPKLRAAHVIVDQEERAGIIREGAKKAAKAAGLTVVSDEGLVVENAGLTEWPAPLLGRFDESFLDVPPEVIQLTARVNQKYFVCEDANGKLANAFICTANIDAADPAVVVDGNRKVLAARLADARFFWELDQKTTLAEHATKLERITFHEKLGTVADKVERVARLARWLCEEGVVKGDADLAEQAARLCKADLVTEMVGEFPELQGLMGGYYAKKEGLPQEVSDAIRDHYKPVGQGDDVPTAPVTVAVSLADKLDTLAGFFYHKMEPTGSKDPFALRRAMYSVIRLVLENRLNNFGRSVAGEAARRIGEYWFAQIANSKSGYKRFYEAEMDGETITDAKQFAMGAEEMADIDWQNYRKARRAAEQGAVTAATYSLWGNYLDDRLMQFLRDCNIRFDVVYAVRDKHSGQIVKINDAAHALQRFLATDNGANLLAGYKRAANILKKEEWEMGAANPAPEPAEAALGAALDEAEPKAASAIESEDFAAAMESLASLRGAVDRFFEDVIVNAEDKNVRASRLTLLARLRSAVHQVADFSRIEG
jgi:glycyl-tRNA synthetase beta chain